MISQVLMLVAAPILTRLYSPDAFGDAAILLAMATPIGAIACLRYDVAIILPKKETEALHLLYISIFLAIILALCIGVLISLFKIRIATFLNAQNLIHYMWCIAPLVLLRGTYSSFNFWKYRNKGFFSVAAAEISTSLGTIGYQIFSAICFIGGSSGLIFGYIFGSTLSTSLLGYQVFKKNGTPSFRRLFSLELLQTAHRYRKFPLFDIWGVLFNSISWQIPALMLAVFFSPTIVGFYALADRIVKIPNLLGGRAISRVLLQHSSDIVKRGDSLSGLIGKIFRLLISVSLLPTLLIGLMGQDIIKIIFGATWIDTGLYLQILSPWMFVWFISSPLSTVFIVYERQELALLIHAAIFFTRLVSFGVGGISGNIYMALGFFSGSGVIVYSLLLALSFRQAKIPLKLLFQTICRYLSYSIPVVAVVGYLKYGLELNSVWLCISLIPMVTVYYFFLYKKEYQVFQSLRI